MCSLLWKKKYPHLKSELVTCQKIEREKKKLCCSGQHVVLLLFLFVNWVWSQRFTYTDILHFFYKFATTTTHCSKNAPEPQWLAQQVSVIPHTQQIWAYSEWRLLFQFPPNHRITDSLTYHWSPVLQGRVRSSVTQAKINQNKKAHKYSRQMLRKRACCWLWEMITEPSMIWSLFSSIGPNKYNRVW